MVQLMEFPDPCFKTKEYLETVEEARRFDYVGHKLEEPDYEKLISYKLKESGNIYIG